MKTETCSFGFPNYKNQLQKKPKESFDGETKDDLSSLFQSDSPTASALPWKIPSSWRLLFGSGLPPALF